MNGAPWRAVLQSGGPGCAWREGRCFPPLSPAFRRELKAGSFFSSCWRKEGARQRRLTHLESSACLQGLQGVAGSPLASAVPSELWATAASGPARSVSFPVAHPGQRAGRWGAAAPIPRLSGASMERPRFPRALPCENGGLPGSIRPEARTRRHLRASLGRERAARTQVKGLGRRRFACRVGFVSGGH